MKVSPNSEPFSLQQKFVRQKHVPLFKMATTEISRRTEYFQTLKSAPRLKQLWNEYFSLGKFRVAWGSDSSRGGMHVVRVTKRQTHPNSHPPLKVCPPLGCLPQLEYELGGFVSPRA